jgi:hypothetical protein
MTIFKDDLAGKKVKWEEGKIHSFTMAEILGEDGVLAMKIALAGYKATKIR